MALFHLVPAFYYACWQAQLTRTPKWNSHVISYTCFSCNHKKVCHEKGVKVLNVFVMSVIAHKTVTAFYYCSTLACFRHLAVIWNVHNVVRVILGCSIPTWATDAKNANVFSLPTRQIHISFEISRSSYPSTISSVCADLCGQVGNNKNATSGQAFKIKLADEYFIYYYFWAVVTMWNGCTKTTWLRLISCVTYVTWLKNGDYLRKLKASQFWHRVTQDLDPGLLGESLMRDPSNHLQTQTLLVLYTAALEERV